MTTLINAGAWVLCGVMAALLCADFIRTEKQLAKIRKEHLTGAEEVPHGTDKA